MSALTVVRLADGGLLLHPRTRHAPELQHAVDQIGPIRHLVAPSVAHWMYLPHRQRAGRDAVTWDAPGLHGRRPVRPLA